MKITLLQEKLRTGLSIIGRVTSKSATLPALENILVKTEKNFISLVSTNLEIAVKWWALVKVEKEGECAVPYSLFSNAVSYLPNKQVYLEHKESTLSLQCGDYKSKLVTNSVEDFPIIPKVSKERSFSCAPSLFYSALEKLIEIPAQSNIRPEISGIYFSISSKEVVVAATDSFRLGEVTIPVGESAKIPAKEKIEFILPQRTARELLHVFSKEEENITIYMGESQILLESKMEETDHPKVQLISRLIDGEYPNYKAIIPKEHVTQVTVEKNEFLNQLKVASLFCGKSNEIRLKTNPKEKKVEISSKSPETGEHSSSLSGTVKGKEMEAPFNFKFLQQGVASIESAEVVLEFAGEEKPLVVKPVGDSSFVYVIAPIKSS